MGEIILAHGNYQELESYQNSVILYDATQEFCARRLKRGDRTIDQMVQAARSGKQNIVEGCMASGISAETEIKLLGVARASLEELLEDYRDYLRVNHLALWAKDEPRTIKLRGIARQKDKSYETYKSYFESADAELVCNLLISLIHQTNFLLDRQLKSLQEDFTKKGGLRERMYLARKAARDKESAVVSSDFDKEMNLLRELYRGISAVGLPDETKKGILHQVEQIADSLKRRGRK